MDAAMPPFTSAAPVADQDAQVDDGTMAALRRAGSF